MPLLEIQTEKVIFQMKQSPKYNIGINYKQPLSDGLLYKIFFRIELDSTAFDWS